MIPCIEVSSLEPSTISSHVSYFQPILNFVIGDKTETKGGSHMRPRTIFVLALHGECIHSNTYKNAFICFEIHF